MTQKVVGNKSFTCILEKRKDPLDVLSKSSFWEVERSEMDKLWP